MAYKTVFVRVNKHAVYNPGTPGDPSEDGDGSNPSVGEVRVVTTRPRRALQPAVIATSIISDMKAIKIWRINSVHPHLDPAAADEYGSSYGSAGMP